MAPARIVYDDFERDSSITTKRRKLDVDVRGHEEERDGEVKEDIGEDASATVPPHPLDIKPSGNAYTATKNIKDHAGLFRRLPDELLMQLLEVLNAADLVRLGSTCKALYAFCRSDDLWKTLFIEHPPAAPFTWRGSWRSTFLSLPPDCQTAISCTNLYSDALYLPFHRGHVPLSSFARNIPARNAISRLSDLTPDDFNTNWASKPFILTDPVRDWPVFHDWSWVHLSEQYSNTTFRAEAVDWPYSTYEGFMRNNKDESPLYLFDCHFAEKMGLASGREDCDAYTPPKCFSPDLFSTLGSHRPDHRWLIIGPARSGSTFHADPNGTSAWNAVIRGSKYWIMFPPVADPAANPMPGLHISSDSSEITAPLSIAEYLLNFHAEARRHPGCIEAVCKEGEVLHVPSGWYHMVLNLEDGIALTQNFVPRAHLVNVLSFLRDKKDQVSGFGRDDVDDKYKGVEEGQEYELFVDRLREKYPDELATALEELAVLDERKGRKSRWEVLTGKHEDNDADGAAGEASAGFSFGFGFGAAGEADDTDDDDE